MNPDNPYVYDAEIPVDPELRAGLDASLQQVRANAGKEDETEYLQSSSKNAERLQKSIAQHKAGDTIAFDIESRTIQPRGHTKHFVTMDDAGFLPADEMVVSARPTITADELNSKMARNGAKQIMADEMNSALAAIGITANYTPEMLSAIAAKNVRDAQKAKRKSKKRK